MSLASFFANVTVTTVANVSAAGSAYAFFKSSTPLPEESVFSGSLTGELGIEERLKTTRLQFHLDQTLENAASYLTELRVSTAALHKRSARNQEVIRREVDATIAMVRNMLPAVVVGVVFNTFFRDVANNLFLRIFAEQQVINPTEFHQAIVESVKRLANKLPSPLELSRSQQQQLEDVLYTEASKQAGTSITSEHIDSAATFVEKNFIKTSFDESHFYWPGDIAITPDGMVLEIPSPLGHYLPLEVSPLWLHRDEFLAQGAATVTKIQAYLQQHQALHGKIAHEFMAIAMHAGCYNKNDHSFVNPVGNQDNSKLFLKKLLNLIEHNLKLNQFEQKFQNFLQYLKGLLKSDKALSSKDLSKIEQDFSEFIKARVSNCIRDVKSTFQTAVKYFQRHPVKDNQVRRQDKKDVVSLMSGLMKTNVTTPHIRYLASAVPDIAFVTLPTEGVLERLQGDGCRFDGGTALPGINMIMLAGYRNLEVVPGIRVDSQWQPRPSVFGGIVSTGQDKGFTMLQSYNADDLSHAFQQTALQECRDFVHGKIAGGKPNLSALMSDTMIQEMRVVIAKTRVRMVRMVIMANRMLQGDTLSKRSTWGIPKELEHYSGYTRKILDPLSQVRDVSFNEKHEWDQFKKCMKKDFATVEAAPRYLLLRVKADEITPSQNRIRINDPLQDKIVEGEVAETSAIKDQEGKVTVKIKLPEITDKKARQAYVVRELAENILFSLFPKETLSYRYDLLFETFGRLAEVYNKFKSAGYYALSEMNKYTKILSDKVDSEFMMNFWMQLDQRLGYKESASETPLARVPSLRV